MRRAVSGRSVRQLTALWYLQPVMSRDPGSFVMSLEKLGQENHDETQHEHDDVQNVP